MTIAPIGNTGDCEIVAGQAGRGNYTIDSSAGWTVNNTNPSIMGGLGSSGVWSRVLDGSANDTLTLTNLGGVLGLNTISPSFRWLTVTVAT